MEKIIEQKLNKLSKDDLNNIISHFGDKLEEAEDIIIYCTPMDFLKSQFDDYDLSILDEASDYTIMSLVNDVINRDCEYICNEEYNDCPTIIRLEGDL